MCHVTSSAAELNDRFRSAVFDQLDLVTYEEVVRVPSFKRKTLVLLGESTICVEQREKEA